MVQQQPILIVDDDPVTLAGWTELLRHAGYDVIGATTFEAARDALESGPRLLIVDVRLGAYNGLQLIHRAQSRRADVAAIVITGFADGEVMREAERLGAVCLEKPVDADQLLAVVARAISHPPTI